MNMSKFALVDCNNFYVSCERIFNPKLEGKPVIILSNNDGCVIARSNEAKEIGIKMGTPAFEIKEIIEKNKVYVFSSNYALYGDISSRITGILASFVSEIEIYSIDEAFLDLGSANIKIPYHEFAKEIKEKIKQWTGVPVSIGIGPTKTLAKIANHLAKKHKHNDGIYSFFETENPDAVLRNIKVEDIWGVGDKYRELLFRNKIKTALDLKNTNEKWAKKQMTIMGARTINELNGISCISIEKNIPDKKGILTSRSFGRPLTDLEDLEQAISTFAVRTGEKLRKQKSCGSLITVFIMTNIFDKGPRYVNSKTIQMPEATSNTNELIKYSIKALKHIYKKGYKYKKTGVFINQIIPENEVQLSIWNKDKDLRFKDVMKLIDNINGKIGQGTIKFGSQGTERKWKMRQEKLSPGYTTKWSEILKINL